MKHIQNLIHFEAEFIIDEGKIEEYKKLLEEMSRVVEVTEPDTLDYQFYLNRDQTKCIVHETYTNSEAVLAHNNGVASQTVLPKISVSLRYIGLKSMGILVRDYKRC